jgi:poly(A) polymerase
MEVFKILVIKNAADLFSLMLSCGILTNIFSKMCKDTFDAFVRAQHHLDIVSTVASYVALTGRDISVGRETILLSKDEERQYRDIAAAYDALPVSGQTPIRRAVYAYGNKTVTQAYVMRCAEVSEPVNMDLLDIARYWRAPVFPVTGQDLMAQGYKQGPELGAALKQMEQDWIFENIV